MMGVAGVTYRLNSNVAGSATFGTPDGEDYDTRTSAHHRYLLRRWLVEPASSPVAPTTLHVVMCNPSMADALADDPTVRRCWKLARACQYSTLLVTNLYSVRTPYPAALRAAPEPVGPQTDSYIAQAAREAHATVVAWGAWAHTWRRERTYAVLELLRTNRRDGAPLLCLGVTNSGAPRHPLYVRTPYRLHDYLGHLAAMTRDSKWKRR